MITQPTAVIARNRNCPGSSAKSGLWPRQRPESQFFQRKFAYRPPLRGGTWAPSRGTWAVTNFILQRARLLAVIAATSRVRCAWFDHSRREKRRCGASCVAPALAHILARLSAPVVDTNTTAVALTILRGSGVTMIVSIARPSFRLDFT